MSARRKPSHLYSVFTHSGAQSRMLYFGSSESLARRAFATAIVRHPQASAIELRRDLSPWLRVSIAEQVPA